MDHLSVQSATVSTLIHATEDKGRVLVALRGLCDGMAVKEFPSQKVKGHYGNDIVMVKMTSILSSEADRFLSELWCRISESDRRGILGALKEYVDSSGTFFVRVDKGEAFHGRFRIANKDTMRVEIHFSVSRVPPGSIVQAIMERLTDDPKSHHQSFLPTSTG